MAQSSRTTTAQVMPSRDPVVKRDPLSSRGGKVPTGSVVDLRPPAGGSKPPKFSSNGSRPEA
jgi:hypothetical protein